MSVKYYSKIAPSLSFIQMLFMAGAAALLVLTLCQPATASDKQAFYKAFEASYAQPDNIDAALAYAKAAAKIQDYEAAIPPLERILMFNPGLSDIRLEVGILYYLLESEDVARKHLVQVSKDPHLSAESKDRVTRYLAKL